MKSTSCSTRDSRAVPGHCSWMLSLKARWRCSTSRKILGIASHQHNPAATMSAFLGEVRTESQRFAANTNFSIPIYPSEPRYTQSNISIAILMILITLFRLRKRKRIKHQKEEQKQSPNKSTTKDKTSEHKSSNQKYQLLCFAPSAPLHFSPSYTPASCRWSALLAPLV
jgi:hypothetical protein